MILSEEKCVFRRQLRRANYMDPPKSTASLSTERRELAVRYRPGVRRLNEITRVTGSSATVVWREMRWSKEAKSRR